MKLLRHEDENVGRELLGDADADGSCPSAVGSVGLIASMSITTALAALLAPRMSDRQLAAEHHSHTH